MDPEPLHVLMLRAFDACEDNTWAREAAGRIRASDNPAVTAVLIEAELEQAAAYTYAVYGGWVSGRSQFW